MSEKMLVKQIDGSLLAVDHLDTALETANADSASWKVDEYNNYVYTIVEHTTKIVIGNDHSHGIKYQTIGTSECVYRSYADEKQAIDYCEGRNSATFELSLSPNSDRYWHDWLFKTFGSSSSTRICDPVTYETICSIRKYVYVQNELFGSALEKEQTWD